MKTAVILFNLGGPDSPAAIRPFLFNFFMDPNIVRLPRPLRFLLASFVSLTRRKAKASYRHLGGRSPLLENSQAQAGALEIALGPGFRVFVCMRYWHPMAAEVVEAVREYGPDKIVLLPLYPQYSTTTTRSAVQQWNAAAASAGLSVPTRLISCYPLDEGFIGAVATLTKTAYDGAARKSGKKPRLLFCAHGLPESVIRAGDPYQRQCEETAKAVVAALGLENPDWAICYQSRVGWKKWTGPPLDRELRRAARDGAPVVICPHSFTQEHVETLVELDIEYRHKAQKYGVCAYERVPALGTKPLFIAALARMARGEGEKTEAEKAA